MVPTKVKKLRIIFNQRNHDFVENDSFPETDMDARIYKDLSERRYEIAKLSKATDDLPLKPVNEENQSLYSQIINIVESHANVEVILDKIIKLLQPSVDAVAYDFPSTLKYTLGTWSIEPIKEKYTQAVGLFDSKPYTLFQGPLISVGLTAEQNLPEATTCEWYINSSSIDIPIIENQNSLRKERMNIVDLSSLSDYSQWTGTFCLLNFPIDPRYYEFLRVFENGTLRNSSRHFFLNSRLVYFHDINDAFKKDYVISYPAATYDSVNLYTLTKNPNAEVDNNITLDIVSSRKEVLRSFIQQFIMNDQGIKADKYYTISASSALRPESILWFTDTFSKVLFVSSKMQNYYNSSPTTNNLSSLLSGAFDGLVQASTSKSSLTVDDVNAYFNDGTDIGFGLFDMPNVAPFPVVTEIQ
jgi:hypothetical protein